MIRAKKIRLFPTEEQEQKMWQSAGTARFIYNWTLGKQQENYKQGGRFIGDNDLRKQITKIKKNNLAWLGEVSNNVAKQAVKDACDAYKKFFKGLGERPRFKSRKKAKPSFYNDTSKLKVNKEAVLLEQIGWVTMKPNQIPTSPCKYKNPRVSYDGKHWYISVGLDQEQPCVELTGESIGIDVGIKNLAICSNDIQER